MTSSIILLVGTSCHYYLNRIHFFTCGSLRSWNGLRVCARFLKLSECEKILTFRLDFVKNFQLQFYFPEDENSTRQTGRVTWDFHSPDGLDTRIGEWASANFQPWSDERFWIFYPASTTIFCSFSTNWKPSMVIKASLICSFLIKETYSLMRNLYFFKNGLQLTIMDLLDTDGQFLSFPDLKAKFSLPKTSFLHYYQVVSAIPNFLFKRAKELILSSIEIPLDEVTSFHLDESTKINILNIKSKDFYWLLPG